VTEIWTGLNVLGLAAVAILHHLRLNRLERMLRELREKEG
jgi:hypothetical protein